MYRTYVPRYNEDITKKIKEKYFSNFRDIEKADAVHRKMTIKYWKLRTNEKKQALYKYTGLSDPFNFALRDNKKLQMKLKMLLVH